MKSKQELYREQARKVLQEAWEINGTYNVEDEMELQLRTLNGLLAIALVEFTARPMTEGKSSPIGGSLVGLRDALGGDDDEV